MLNTYEILAVYISSFFLILRNVRYVDIKKNRELGQKFKM